MEFPGNYSQIVTYYASKVVETVRGIAEPEVAIIPILYQEVLDYGYQHNFIALFVHGDPFSYHDPNGGDVSSIPVISVELYLLDLSVVAWKNYTRNATADKFHVIATGDWNLADLHREYDWTKYYQQDIREFGGSDEEASLVIGGKATLWGTSVDEINAITLAWPRGAAVAERLWSQDRDTIEEFTQRISELRCRMV
ncbi:unnamed protein product [Trichobilharzia regenti]|nr:unnamed protein product [Trichobilharzia regenti]